MGAGAGESASNTGSLGEGMEVGMEAGTPGGGADTERIQASGAGRSGGMDGMDEREGHTDVTKYKGREAVIRGGTKGTGGGAGSTEGTGAGTGEGAASPEGLDRLLGPRIHEGSPDATGAICRLDDG